MGENFGEAQNAQDGSFPSREAVAVASAELAQNLGISQEQALDRVVSAVLQQRRGGVSLLLNPLFAHGTLGISSIGDCTETQRSSSINRNS